MLFLKHHYDLATLSQRLQHNMLIDTVNMKRRDQSLVLNVPILDFYLQGLYRERTLPQGEMRNTNDKTGVYTCKLYCVSSLEMKDKNIYGIIKLIKDVI